MVDIKIDEEYITLQGWYHIPLSRCDTAQKMVSWLLHLSEKRWFTLEYMRAFILQVGTKIKVNIYLP